MSELIGLKHSIVSPTRQVLIEGLFDDGETCVIGYFRGFWELNCFVELMTKYLKLDGIPEVFENAFREQNKGD